MKMKFNKFYSIIILMSLLNSCVKENREKLNQNNYKEVDSLKIILKEFGLKQYLTKEEIYLVDKNYNSLVQRYYYSYAYLTDSIFLEDKGDLLYSLLPEGAVFDYHDNYLIFFDRGKGPDNVIHIYNRITKKRSEYLLKKDINPTLSSY
jgi:hypothetical protein